MTNNNTLLDIKVTLVAIAGALTAVWGWLGWMAVAWIGLMLADWILGSAAAVKEGRWSSAKLREGAWHKCGMIVVVCVAMVADWLISTLLSQLPVVELPIEYHVLLGPLVIVWYIIGELGSLAETAVKMGTRIPKWLPKILAICQESIDTAGEKITADDNNNDNIEEEK